MSTTKMFDALARATTKAFDRAGKTLGQETDPDLKLYDELKSNDFPELIRQYGEASVMQYIQTMEARRLQRGRNNG